MYIIFLLNSYFVYLFYIKVKKWKTSVTLQLSVHFITLYINFYEPNPLDWLSFTFQVSSSWLVEAPISAMIFLDLVFVCKMVCLHRNGCPSWSWGHVSSPHMLQCSTRLSDDSCHLGLVRRTSLQPKKASGQPFFKNGCWHLVLNSGQSNGISLEIGLVIC